MKLCILESPERLAYLDKILSKTISIPDKRLAAANALLDIDPTNQKRLAQWLARLVAKGFISISGIVAAGPNNQVKIPEDSARISDTLATFERSKPRIETQFRDINNYPDFYSLENKLEEVVSSGRTEAVGSSIVKKVPGAQIIYRDDTYTLYLIEKIKRSKSGEYSEEEQKRIHAVEVLGMGPPETKWCTREAYHNPQADYYLSRHDIFVLYKNGMPFIQQCGSQVMNVLDHPADMPKELDALITSKIQQLTAKRKAEAEAIIAKTRKKFKELVASGGAPEGRNLILTTNGVIIDCARIVDVGDMYYVGVNKLNSPKEVIRPMKRTFKEELENSGFASFDRIRKYNYYIKSAASQGDYYTRIAHRNMANSYKSDSSTMLVTRWNYDPVLTVNKENVADMITV